MEKRKVGFHQSVIRAHQRSRNENTFLIMRVISWRYWHVEYDLNSCSKARGEKNGLSCLLESTRVHASFPSGISRQKYPHYVTNWFLLVYIAANLFKSLFLPEIKYLLDYVDLLTPSSPTQKDAPQQSRHPTPNTQQIAE